MNVHVDKEILQCSFNYYNNIPSKLAQKIIDSNFKLMMQSHELCQRSYVSVALLNESSLLYVYYL